MVDKGQDDIGEGTRAHSHFLVDENTSFHMNAVWIDEEVLVQASNYRNTYE